MLLPRLGPTTAGAMMATLGPNQVYPTDLTDAQWAVIEPLLTRRAGPGRPQVDGLRLIVNAIL